MLEKKAKYLTTERASVAGNMSQANISHDRESEGRKVRKYLTTTLPYVNANPHIGFALEVVQADSLARYWRILGHEVFFNTGTDEHGQKIAQIADEKGESRQSYVDHYAAEFNRLKEGLNLSYDNFIRTTDASHKVAAQEIWRRCDEKGDIYKKSFKGLYCVGDEMFLRDSDLVDGKCPNHPNMEPIELEEENYFFKLSNYQEALLGYFSRENSIVPEWQRQWAIEFVKGGLEDLSISRQKTRMDWGIPVPNDDEHVMYVWFDALTNYISTLGWPNTEGDFKKFWVESDTLQLAGKDQVRFQSIIWQAMLMSADIKTTDVIYYHGFINSGGQKMSKSLGNVISPYEMIQRYGTDATRYILLRHVHPFDDSDLTWEKMDEYYTANLVNGLGNLVARVMKMSESHLEMGQYAPLEQGEEQTLDFNFQQKLNDIWHQVQVLDEMISETEPFKLIKTDPEKAIEILTTLRDSLRKIGATLAPYMPETARIIITATETNQKPDNLFVRLES
ncbi:MAG: methionine--tRNA ligase [Candidatus Pacebacteria bacterium]|nr:methionine--tRNA ligase [Candidatus Paceibacterota bacterium]MBP9842826.1 methionine--tRNA ligase [Candidatus Paceibacterota bacterium]